MFNAPGPVSALTTASAYPAELSLEDAARVRDRADRRAQAGIGLRFAQVQLYCDHPGPAVLMTIHRADRRWQAAGEHAAAAEPATLARATWALRHHDTSASVAALEPVLSRLAT